MVSGLFRDRNSAERAYGSLTSRGYNDADINVLMSDESRSRVFPPEQGQETEFASKALECATTGVAIGGAMGGIVAAVEGGWDVRYWGIQVCGRCGTTR